jgi:hypothetical protein
VKDQGQPGEILYWRTGTYRTTGMAQEGNNGWERVVMDGRFQAVQWLAYPGEAPILDNDHAPANIGRFIRLVGTETTPVYVDGLAIEGTRHLALQFQSGSCDYPVFRNLRIHNIFDAIDGGNSAGIMTMQSYSDATWYGAFQDNDFRDNRPGGIKLYSHERVLWEDSLFHGSGGGPALKAHVPRFEVRGCEFYDNEGIIAPAGLFGNMNFGDEENGFGSYASGEIRFNRFACGDSWDILAAELNQDGQAASIHVYRNTIVGTIRVRAIAENPSTDGPFDFYKNVVVHSGPQMIRLDEDVNDPSRVLDRDNVFGPPSEGIVDADGDLTPAYEQYLGTHGWQIR